MRVLIVDETELVEIPNFKGIESIEAKHIKNDVAVMNADRVIVGYENEFVIVKENENPVELLGLILTPQEIMAYI